MPNYIQPSPASLLYTRVAGLLLMCLVGATVWAEHEADHRYTVEGFVLDAQENPRPDVSVVITAEEGPSGRAVTDRRGFYRIQLHLHNTDFGKRLTVKAGEQKTEIDVTFDPADKEAERVHELNFIGAQVSQTDLGARGFPTWVYIVFAVVVAVIVARSAATAIKRRRKHVETRKHKKKTKKRKKPRHKRRS